MVKLGFMIIVITDIVAKNILNLAAYKKLELKPNLLRFLPLFRSLLIFF